jgi:hypothetical protein
MRHAVGSLESCAFYLSLYLTQLLQGVSLIFVGILFKCVDNSSSQLGDLYRSFILLGCVMLESVLKQVGDSDR